MAGLLAVLKAGLMNLRTLFLSTLKFLAFRISWSRLSHSITAEKDNKVFEKLCFF